MYPAIKEISVRTVRYLPVILLFVCMLSVETAHTARIKDIADIRGVRTNQLVGYGLVVGLDGTGDGAKSAFTTRSLASMLEKMGLSVKPEEIRVGNVAAVMITAELPPFVESGSRIDVLVSSIGDAKNLQGGTLVLTPLRAVNGRVYAVAQGPVSTGGFSSQGEAASVRKNFPTVGRISGGAIVEKNTSTDFAPDGKVTLMLHHPDFTTAARIAKVINQDAAASIAEAPTGGTVEIRIPEAYSRDFVGFVTRIEHLVVTPDIPAKVVINERTGTVVMGENVRISTVAIAHGNLSIEIREPAAVSQPAPFSRGKTVVVPQSEMRVSEGKNKLMTVESGANIGDVVRALNALGVTPRDLIAILTAMKAAGALQAELEII